MDFRENSNSSIEKPLEPKVWDNDLANVGLVPMSHIFSEMQGVSSFEDNRTEEEKQRKREYVAQVLERASNARGIDLPSSIFLMRDYARVACDIANDLEQGQVILENLGGKVYPAGQQEIKKQEIGIIERAIVGGFQLIMTWEQSRQMK